MSGQDLFLQRYEKLNEAQRKAVNTIYGPVMVIAGPGTGKTEVLSLRIANLLRSDAQVQPHEILCLTYTDEAANSMRRRLLQIIGPAAHKIFIATFHAFCNRVIQEHPWYFSERPLQPVTELESAELMHELIDELPRGHPFHRTGAGIYHDASRLLKFFEMMKKEDLSAEFIADKVDEYIASLPEREEFKYQRNGKGFQKGDLKVAKIEEETQRMAATKAAALLFPVYRKKMKDRGLYDYSDMILWVLEKFRTEPALLQNYQERFQYILVDEFQDTNGAQSELLYTLTQFWEDPNIFVVGDDDQSIYEFQGARIRNIIDFYERHSHVEVIVLPHNYRSSQAIIDKASAAISNNLQRLIYQLKDVSLSKDFIAANERFKDGKETIEPVITVYPNIISEEAGVVLEIEKLQKAGVTLNNVALIYAQHKQADNILSLFEKKGIPYNIKKPVNAFREPLVMQLMLLLRYLDAERTQPFSGEGYLFEILHALYYSIRPIDLAHLSLNVQQQPRESLMRNWRVLLSNGLHLQTLSLESLPALIRMGNNLDSWLQSVSSHPLPLLVEKLVYESGIVNWVLQQKDHIWQIEVLHTFFSFVQAQYNSNDKTDLKLFLRIIDKMEAEGISLPVEKVIRNDNGVHCYTAHSAKGNEFEHVFLIGCTKNFWEGKVGNNQGIKLPDTITATEEDQEKTYKVEVARRLFYVALTRAKKHLHISYALQGKDMKELVHSCFIDEISKMEARQLITMDADDMVQHLAWAIKPRSDDRIELANRAWLERVLQNFSMSYTALSKFLRCPLEFYYELILKVPCLPGEALGFGIAVHSALERFFGDMKKEGKFGEQSLLIKYFEQALYREQESMTAFQYDRRLEQGRSILASYYDKNISRWPMNVELEWKAGRMFLDGIPVTGKIDKLELEEGMCTIVDYKTGNSEKAKVHLAVPSEKEPNGGDYWRQMVFYKLLIENHPDKKWKVKMGAFDYVEPDRKSGKHPDLMYVPMFDEDERHVRAQLKEAYGRIMNHDFDKGCGKEECHWCNFSKQYAVIRQEEEKFAEIDDV